MTFFSSRSDLDFQRNEPIPNFLTHFGHVTYLGPVVFFCFDIGGNVEKTEMIYGILLG